MMALSRGFVGGLLLAAAGSAVACGSSDDDSNGGSGTGGTSTTGGSSGKGGTSTTGGTSGKGGSSSTSGGTSNSGGSGDATGGSGGSGDATGGSSGSSGTGGSSGSSGNCTVPACVSDLTADCTPSGACVEQQGNSTDFSMPFTDAVCYANGVAASSSFDFSTGNVTVTVSKNGDTCFSEEAAVDLSTGTSSDLTIKDGSGKTVATATTDADGNTVISCGGKTYTLDASCDSTMAPGMMMMGGTSDCTMGTCVP